MGCLSHTNSPAPGPQLPRRPVIQFSPDTNWAPGPSAPHMPAPLVPAARIRASGTHTWLKKVEGSYNPSPFSGSIILLELLRKPFIYYYWFIMKDTTQEQAGGREAQDQEWRRVHGPSTPHPGAPPSRHLAVSTSPEAFQDPVV